MGVGLAPSRLSFACDGPSIQADGCPKQRERERIKKHVLCEIHKVRFHLIFFYSLLRIGSFISFDERFNTRERPSGLCTKELTRSLCNEHSQKKVTFKILNHPKKYKRIQYSAMRDSVCLSEISSPLEHFRSNSLVYQFLYYYATYRHRSASTIVS